MSSVNKVILLGYVGQPPEIRQSKAGENIANFTLATSRYSTNPRTGEREQNTSWHYITCFKRIADIIAQYVTKGSRLYVEGSLDYGEYTDKQGIKRYTTKIIAQSIQMLSAKGERDETEPQQESSPQDYQSAKNGVDLPPGDFDDDVPF